MSFIFYNNPLVVYNAANTTLMSDLLRKVAENDTYCKVSHSRVLLFELLLGAQIKKTKPKTA